MRGDYVVILKIYLPIMPRAIISPSVLASDFGQLTAECKRMILGGAEWLHMGKFSDLFSPYISHLPFQTLWMGKLPTYNNSQLI